MDFWQTVIAGIVTLIVGTAIITGSVWLWRTGKALRESVKRLEAANEAQAAENAAFRLYAGQLEELEAKFQDTLSGEARRSLASDMVKLLVSNSELKKEVAKLQEDLRNSRSTADGGMLPAQRLEQQLAARQLPTQPTPVFDREKLDRL